MAWAIFVSGGYVLKKDEIKPWEESPHIWPTEASFMAYIRGGIRRGLWERHPVKLEFLKESRVRAPVGKSTKKEPNGRTVFAYACCECGELYPASSKEIQVDHKKGHHSVRSKQQIQSFVEAMIYVRKEDLQTICKKCHDIKSYAERMGLTLEQAAVEKEIIKFKNLKANEQISVLKKYKVSGKNSEERCNIYRQLYLEGKTNDKFQ